MSVATGSLTAVEALTRFSHAAGGGAEDVFADAHAGGYGCKLEAMCVRRALARRAELPAGTLISVNLSPDGLRSLAQAEIWPDDLAGVIIEVTEQDSTDDRELRARLESFRDRGASIAIDDVGSGYAGLLRVAELRPSYVKVDRRIVSGLLGSVAQTAVLESLVTLSHRLGAAVIAEGVEDLADLDALAQFDVDYAQGYAIGRPASPVEPVADAVVQACRDARRRVLAGPAFSGVAASRTRDVYSVTAALVAAGDRVDLERVIAGAAVELGVDTISVSIVTPDNALREIAVAGAPPDPTPYPLADYPATVAALSNAGSLEVQVDDPTGDSVERELMRSFGQASLLLVPVVADGRPIGSVEVINDTPRRWNAADIAYTRGLASHLVPVLGRSGFAHA